MNRLTERINGKLTTKKQFPTTRDTIDVLIDMLAIYEDLEEQGRLIKLPCKVGDTLYGIMLNELKEYKVFAINIGMRKHENSCVVLANNNRNAVVNFELIDFGKTVFLTREEAERELEGVDDKTAAIPAFMTKQMNIPAIEANKQGTSKKEYI